MHNWQNDGKQKEKLDPMIDSKCLTGCGKLEDHGHYLQCQHEIMQKEQSKLQTSLLQKMGNSQNSSSRNQNCNHTHIKQQMETC